jgi:hypothetical protein
MESIKALADAVGQVIGENKDQKRFIDISRIPLICLSITQIHENIKELKEMMKEQHEIFATKEDVQPIRYITFGLVGMIMAGFVGSVLTLVFK